MNNTDKLLHGKNPQRNIVGIEVTDDSAEIFIQNEDGNVSSIFAPNRFWLLASTNIDGKFSRLNGDLYYKWGRLFQERSDFQKMRSIYKNQGHDIFTVWNPEEAIMIKDGYSFYRGLKQKDISLLSFDLETTGLDGKAPDAKIVLISTTYRDQHGMVNKLFSHDEYSDEGEMIHEFCMYVRNMNPSLLVGHNVIGFDFLYLQDRADANLVPFVLGRDDSMVKFANYESKFRLDGTRNLMYKAISVYGREIVDTFLLANKMDVSKKYQSYSLKPLIKEMGLEKEGRQYYDAQNIRKDYLDLDKMKLIKQYAIEDAEDPIKLWDHFGGPQFYWAQNVPKPFTELLLGATGSQINSMLLRSYIQEKHGVPKADPIEHFDGAITYGKPGIYSNCIRWDVASLYPSIILTYNVCNLDKDPRGNFLAICKTLTEERLKNKKLAKETKDQYYEDLQNSQKIAINSMYGFMGATGLNFNSLKHAELITKYGREILLKAINWATGKDYEQELYPDTEEETE